MASISINFDLLAATIAISSTDFYSGIDSIRANVTHINTMAPTQTAPMLASSD